MPTPTKSVDESVLNVYSLAGGMYQGPDYTRPRVPVLDEAGQPVKDARGQPVLKRPQRVVRAGEGDVVLPPEIAARGGLGQFVLRGEYRDGQRAEGATRPEGPTAPPKTGPRFTAEQLSGMTVKALQDLAAAEEIDLGSAQVKADVVDAILRATGAR